MGRERIHLAARVLATLGLIAGGSAVASAASAQTPDAGAYPWRIGASTGGYVAPSALIRAADDYDTRLAAGPAFSVEPQYLVSDQVSIYGNGTLAFGTIQLGSSIQPAVVGPSNQVMLVGATAGVMLSPTDWFGAHVQPTLRLGGGLKWYRFDLTDAENQARPTTDIGVGLRGVGVGTLEGTVEVRWLLSSFDQAKLPTRGIAPQEQRQHDFVLSVGIGIRP